MNMPDQKKCAHPDILMGSVKMFQPNMYIEKQLMPLMVLQNGLPLIYVYFHIASVASSF